MLINTQLLGCSLSGRCSFVRMGDVDMNGKRVRKVVLVRACCKILPGKHSIWLVGRRNKFVFMEVKQSPALGGERFSLSHIYTLAIDTTWAQKKVWPCLGHAIKILSISASYLSQGRTEGRIKNISSRLLPSQKAVTDEPVKTRAQELAEAVNFSGAIYRSAAWK